MAPSVYVFSEEENKPKLLVSTSKETVELEKEAGIEEKKEKGREYYSTLNNKEIGKLLAAVWKVLYHSSSFKEYSSNPQRDLNAIDMLIEETKGRIGDVESAPISTYIYDRDMTNADETVRECFEKKAQHKSPDNHPEFAAREAKIAALLSALPGCDELAEIVNSARQGKGRNSNDKDTPNEYRYGGIWGSQDTHHTTLKNIEKFVSKPYVENDFTYDSDEKKVAKVFVCAGECKSDASVLLKNREKQKDIEGLKRKWDALMVKEDLKGLPVRSRFVEKNLRKILKDRDLIEAVLEATGEANSGPVDIKKILEAKGKDRQR